MLESEDADLFRAGLISRQAFPAYTQTIIHDDIALSRKRKLYTKEDNTPA